MKPEPENPVERIAVAANDGLIIDRQRLAAMFEFAETGQFDTSTEIHVALGSHEVVGRDDHYSRASNG